MLSDSRQLRKTFRRTLVVLLIAVLAAGVVTYAWYIYNTSRHVTDVKMAAGTGVTFLISNSFDGDYKTSAGLAFKGFLDPVSTDNIENGFQKVTGFTGGTSQSSLLANVFAPAQRSDYYETSLFLTTSSVATDVYLADIAYDDEDPDNPISTALRVGFAVHAPGQGQPVVSQYIFELTQMHNLQGRYNTYNGSAGDVLDSSRSDGSTVTFTPLNSSNYCQYNDDTGELALLPSSTMLWALPAASANADHGTPVQVDVYVWLEGCDEDCTNNLANTNLESLALHFAGKQG